MNHRLLTLLTLLVALVGCGDPGVSGGGACRTDDECAAGLHCYAERWCVSTPAEARDIVLRMAPPPGSDAVLEYFDGAVGGGSAIGQAWQLTRPAVVRGTVLRAGDALSASIPGRLLATAPSKVLGANLRYEAQSQNALTFFEGATVPHGFELRLQAGPTYDVVFWPDSAEIPPYYTTWTVSGDAEGWTVQLTAEVDLIKVRGRLRRGSAAQLACDKAGVGAHTACAENCTGLAGLVVQLQDDAGRVRSSRSVTDAEGAFEVAVDAAAGTVRLAILPGPDASTPIRGQLAAALELEPLRKLDQKVVELGDLLAAGPISDESLGFTVVDADGAAVAGAHVRVQAALPVRQNCVAGQDGKGVTTQPLFSDLRMERKGVTGADGAVAFVLPAGQVEVDAVPPMQHPAGAVHVGVAVTAASPAQIACPSRRVLSGTLVDIRQVAVADAGIHLERIDAEPGKGGAQQPLVYVQTDPQGNFALLVDPGRYAVVAVPPEGSGLARAVVKVVEVTAAHDPLPLALVLPAPSVLVGRVLDADGNPAQQILVDVFAQQVSSLVVPDTGDGGQKNPGGGSGEQSFGDAAVLTFETHRLGSVTTDIDGRFELLVTAGQLAAP